MTRRSKWIVTALIVAVPLAGLVAAGGFVFVKELRRQAWLTEARDAFAAQDWETASDRLSRFLPHDPSNRELLEMYAAANAEILTNRTSALRNVAHAYHQILRYEPDSESVQHALIDLYERQGAWDVLEYYASEWLRDRPDDRRLLAARAEALYKAGSRDSAMDAFEKLFASHQGASEELRRYAELLRERSGAAAAETFLDGQIAARPDSADVLIGAALYWLESGDVGAAKHFADRAWEAAPETRSAQVLRARIAASERRWDEAVALLTERAPGDAETVSLLANVYLAKGDPEAAAETLLSASPVVRVDHPRLQILLIDTLYGLERLDEARDASALYMDAYPLDTATENYIAGRDALTEDKPAQAADALAIAVEMRPDFRAARLALAVAAVESGDMRRGRNVLEAYLREFPDDSRARSLWARYIGLEAVDPELLAMQADDSSSLSAAALLADAAVRENALAERIDAIHEAAQRAIAAKPNDAGPYRLLVDAYLRLGDPARARDLVKRAEDAKVDEVALDEMRADVALAMGDVDEAWTRWSRHSDDFNAEQFRVWARRFAAAGDIEAGLRVLDLASRSWPGDQFSIDRAELLAESGSLDAAWQELERATQNGAGGQQLNRVRLLLVSRLDDTENAAAQLEPLSDIASDSSDPYAKLIKAFLVDRGIASGDVEPLLRDAERFAPNDPLVLDQLRAFSERRGDAHGALNYARRAAAAQPDNDRLQFALGRLQAQQGEHSAAAATFRAVHRRNPENAAAVSALVQALLDAGATGEAAGVLESAGDIPGLERLRSRVMVALEDHGLAEQLLRKRVAEAPDDRAARWDLAVSLREQGRGDEALLVLRDAAESSSGNAQDWAMIAAFLAEQSDAEAARAALRALLIDPHQPEALQTLARIRSREGDPAAALAIWRRYTDAQPADAAAWYQRAQFELAAGGLWSDALTSIEEAYRLEPTAAYRALRGFIHAELGNNQQAIEDLEESGADLGVTSVQFDLALASCYLAENRLDSARLRLATARRKVTSGEPPQLQRLEAALAAKEAAQ